MFKRATQKSDEAIEDEGKESEEDCVHDEPETTAEEDEEVDEDEKQFPMKRPACCRGLMWALLCNALTAVFVTTT